MTNEDFLNKYQSIALKFDQIFNDIPIAPTEQEGYGATEELIKFIKDNTEYIVIEPLKTVVRLYLGYYDYRTIGEPNRLTKAVYHLADLTGVNYLSQILLDNGASLK